MGGQKNVFACSARKIVPPPPTSKTVAPPLFIITIIIIIKYIYTAQDQEEAAKMHFKVIMVMY